MVQMTALPVTSAGSDAARGPSTGLEKPEKCLLADFFWSKVPASLDNFASEASFSKRGTCSVPSAGLVNFASFSERGTRSMPSARSADRGSAPGGWWG